MINLNQRVVDPWRFRASEKYDYRDHSCGCETFWSLTEWKSITVNRCDEHAPFDPYWSTIYGRNQ